MRASGGEIQNLSYRRLKLELLLYGIAVDDQRLSEKILALPAEELPVATRRVDLTFPDGTRVNAPLEEGSPYQLRLLRPGVAVLRGKGMSVEAKSILTSDFHQRRTSFGNPFSDIGQICGGYFFLPLGAQPAAESPDVPAKNGALPNLLVKHDLREVHEVLSAAFQEKLVEVVKIAVRLPVAFDKSAIEQLLPYLAMVKSNFKCVVSLSIPPPKDFRLLSLLYARGVDIIFCDLLLVDEKRSSMHLPLRSHFSTEDILETLGHLVGIFPRGAVLSRLLVGWEPIEETARASERLLSIGAVPILSLIPAGRDRLSSVVLDALYDFLLSLHIDLDRNLYSRWIHSHLHLISDGITPNDSLEIEMGEHGPAWTDRLFVTRWSRRALASAWALRREFKIIEGGPPSDGGA